MVNKIKFIIPDFLSVEECTYLLSTFSSHKEVFRDNVEIIGFVGSFVGCVWNKKNKSESKYRLNKEMLLALKKKYNDEFKVSMFIHFDNAEINNEMLDDEYSNHILKIFGNKLNYVICESKKLKEYIKENYKNVNIIGTDYRDDTSEYAIINEYNLNDLCQNPNKNKFILIPDYNCVKKRKNKFKHSVKDSVLHKINPRIDRYYNKNNSSIFNSGWSNEDYLSFEKLSELSNKGIDKFMLSGMGVYNVAMYENIIEYLVKEEYQTDFRKDIYPSIVSYKLQEEQEIYNYRL